MGQSGSIIIDLKARVSGYEASLKQMQQAFSKVDLGSEIGKKLQTAIQQATAPLNNLSKNLTPHASSDSQIDAIVEKANRAGEAVRKVGQLMQQIGTQDVNFGGFSNSISDLTTQISALEAQLNGKIADGMREIVSKSTEFSQAFKDLDINKMSPDNFFDVLKQKAKEAQQEVEASTTAMDQAQKKVAQKNTALAQAEANPLNNKDALQNELTQITQSYTQAIERIRSDVQKRLDSMIGKNDPKTAETLLNQFMGGLTPENLKQHLMTLEDSIQAELKNGISAKEVYTNFGDLGFGDNAVAVSTTLVNKIFPNIEDIKEQFRQKISEISTSLTPAQVGQIFQFLDANSIESALNSAFSAIENGYKKLQGRIVILRREVEEAVNANNVAAQALNAAEGKSTQVDTLYQDLLTKYNTLENNFNNLTQEIANLKSSRVQEQQKITTDIQKTGQTGGQSAKTLQISTQEAIKYKVALDQVKQGEQLIGRIQGVVQRWFSIYAAVRMVSNAIKEVINTVKELDKTITEIAIVTNMSQSDLWGQMDKYTEIAREYASSISGVYKVSQLYYQQGKLMV